MIDKEVSELRRRWKPEHSAVTKLYGRFVRDNGELGPEFEESLALLPQQAQEIYFSILKKTLSGKLGKTLTDVCFTTAQVVDSDEHRLLMRLRDSRLGDSDAREQLYAAVAQTYKTDCDYLILLASDCYDVPYRSSDDVEQEDAGETQFSYFLCSVCPIKEAAPVLRYDAVSGAPVNRNAEAVISAPELGFLFPAFDDRATNLYGALYYTRGGNDTHEALYDRLFRVKAPMAVPAQKDSFREVLTEALAEECSQPVVQAVHSGLREMVQLHKEARIPAPLEVAREEIGEVLADAGVSEKHLAAFNVKYDSAFGTDSTLPPQNLLGANRLEYRTPSAVLRLDPDRRELVSLRKLGDVRYLLLNVEEGLTLNDVPLQPED